MVRVGARIRLSAEEKDATRGLERVAAAARNTTSAVNRIGRGAAVAVGAVMGLNTAEAALRTTVRLLTDSVREYAKTDERLSAQLAGTAEMVTGFRQALGEAVIGGEEGQHTLGLLQQTIDGLTNAVRDNQTAIREMVQGALVGMIRTAEIAVRVVGGLGHAKDVLRLAVAGATVVLVELAAALSQGVTLAMTGATAAAASLARALESVFGGLAEAALSARQFELAMTLDQAAGSMRRMRQGADAATVSLVEQTSAIRDMRDAARGMLGDTIESTLASMVERDARIQDVAGAIGGLADALASGEGGWAVYASGAASAQAQVQQAGEAIVSMLEIMAEKEVSLAQWKRDEIARVDTEIKERRLADETARKESDRIEAERQMELARRVAEAQIEALRARQAAASDASSRMLDSLGRVADGDQSFIESTRQTLADELMLRARRYAVEAAALAFVPGQQGRAAGLGLAAVGMRIAAGQIRGGGGGGGGGGTSAESSGMVAPAMASSSTSTSNVSNTFNLGVVGDVRAASRMVADLNAQAARDGYQGRV